MYGSMAIDTCWCITRICWNWNIFGEHLCLAALLLALLGPCLHFWECKLVVGGGSFVSLECLRRVNWDKDANLSTKQQSHSFLGVYRWAGNPTHYSHDLTISLYFATSRPNPSITHQYYPSMAILVLFTLVAVVASLHSMIWSHKYFRFCQTSLLLIT